MSRSGNFVFSWSWNSGSAKGTECDTGFQSLFSRASETLEFALPFFSHTLLSCHARKTKRERPTSKIDHHKHCKLAEKNLFCLCLCEQECFHRKKKISEPKFQEREDAESFEINWHLHVFLGNEDENE